jgi:hypothetical protein
VNLYCMIYCACIKEKIPVLKWWLLSDELHWFQICVYLPMVKFQNVVLTKAVDFTSHPISPLATPLHTKNKRKQLRKGTILVYIHDSGNILLMKPSHLMLIHTFIKLNVIRRPFLVSVRGVEWQQIVAGRFRVNNRRGRDVN